MAGIVRVTLAGFLGAAAGWIGLAAAVLVIGQLLGMPQRDGGMAMGAFFVIGPVGGLVGFLAGGILALRRHGQPTFGVIVARLSMAAGLLSVLAGIAAATAWYARPLVAPNAMPPDLLFEVRLPAGASPPPLVSREQALARRSPIEFGNSQAAMAAEIVAVREEAGRVLVSGRVPMPFRVAERQLVWTRPGGARPVRFVLRLGRSPSPSASFGAWQPEAGGQAFEVRYRVVEGGG